MSAPVLVDTNVLLRWLQATDPLYPQVSAAIEALAAGDSTMCYTSQNVAEFWNVSTRPVKFNGYGLSTAETDRRVQLFESRLQLLVDSAEVHDEFRRILVAQNVRGVQVHDARLVASMRVHGIARILTLNVADFSRYADIQAVHPTLISRL